MQQIPNCTKTRRSNQKEESGKPKEKAKNLRKGGNREFAKYEGKTGQSTKHKQSVV